MIISICCCTLVSEKVIISLCVNRERVFVFVFVCPSALCLSVCFVLQEDCLLRNVLQPERPRALLAVDVWCFVARFGSAHLCRQHCVTLSQLYLLSSSPSAASSVTFGHLRLLVARLVKFLAPEHQVNSINRSCRELVRVRTCYVFELCL